MTIIFIISGYLISVIIAFLLGRKKGGLKKIPDNISYCISYDEWAEGYQGIIYTVVPFKRKTLMKTGVYHYREDAEIESRRLIKIFENERVSIQER